MSAHVRYPAFRLSASVVYVAVPKRTLKAAMQASSPLLEWTCSVQPGSIGSPTFLIPRTAA